MIDISGAVVNPGVYELLLEAGVQDALQQAGGLLSDANSIAVNMAARLMDGQKIIIPVEWEQIPETRSDSPAVQSDSAAVTNDQPININTATEEELESLPDIGPSKAKAIMEFREENGAFSTIEDILEVPGIGEKIPRCFFGQDHHPITRGNLIILDIERYN